MALRLSTGLRNALLSQRAEVQHILQGTANMALVDGDTGNDSITDSDNTLGDFTVHDKITLSGCDTSANDVSVEILSVAAGEIEIPTGSVDTEEALLTSTILASARGGSISDLFRNCVIDIYSGSQPTDADSVETGVKLVTITLSSGAFTGGAAANGLNFDEAASGVLSKDADETWSGEGLADGTAGWFRMYDNGYETGASTSEIRLDGSIATSGAQLNLSNTTITDGGTTTVDSAELTMPAS